MTLRVFLTVILLTAVIPITARSQVMTPKSGPRTDEEAALRQKAISLLESIAEQFGGLQSPENRARIGSNLANLLWEKDEKRSRELLAGAAQDIRTWTNEVEGDETETARELAVISKLRGDIVDRIAKRDLEVALEFLRSTRPLPRIDAEEKTEKTLRNRNFDYPADQKARERMLELQLAQRAAGKNSRFAVQLGREMMAQGLSPAPLALLAELWRKDKAGASVFYKIIVDQLPEPILAKDSAAFDLLVQLARAYRPPAVEEQAYRNLLSVILTASLDNGCSDAQGQETPPLCYQIAPLFPAMEKYFGSRVAPLKRFGSSAEEAKGAATLEQAREIDAIGTVDEMLNFASQHPEMEYLRWNALTKAEEAGDFDKAQQVAESSSDVDVRRNMLARVEARRKWMSLTAEKLITLQQKLSELPSDEFRIGVILEVARQVAPTDRKGALGLLDQANQLLQRSKSAKAQFQGQASVAMMYAMLKSDRGFPILEAIMPKLNELVAASAVLDGVDFSYLRQGEWNMSGDGAVGATLNELALSAEYFARLDFDRSVSLTTQLQRAELRLMAQEKIAEGILAPTNRLSLKVNPPFPLDNLLGK